MARHRTGFQATLAFALCIAVSTRPSLGAGELQRLTLDGVLGAYLGGDFDIIQRTFVQSLTFQAVRLDKPREIERWLGAWDRGKALLLLELARTSAGVAPHYVAGILGAGRRFVATARETNGATDQTADFAQIWHRAAAALLQGASEPARVEEHVTGLGRANAGPNGPVDGRLLLARGVAQERRCWTQRPSLDQFSERTDALLEAAGARVPDDLDGRGRTGREAAVGRHSGCLREALSRFEAAAGIADIAAEARVRGGWTLFQDGRAAEALEWLEAARPGGDRELEYWHELFRGRVLHALGRFQDAASAYHAALALYPGAQSAGTGLSIALMHLDRTKDADDAARAVRGTAATTADPWLHYIRGDDRFTGRWIDSMRTMVR